MGLGLLYSYSPITDFQHGSAGCTIMESAEPRPRELTKSVPKNLKSFPSYIEENCAIRFSLFGKVARDGVGIGSGSPYQSISENKR